MAATRHFDENLRALTDKLFVMGKLVEKAIDNSLHALFDRDRNIAQRVLLEEEEINRMEIEIDDLGHSLSALMQPMAMDLRLITAILKINTDMERMGDHAVNIAERALLLIEEPRLEIYVQLPEMADKVQKMLGDALLALSHEDAQLARTLLRRDDEVDACNDALYFKLEEMMEKDASLTRAGMNLVMVGHNLERIADLANNIAEDIIYMKQGREVRHHAEGID